MTLPHPRVLVIEDDPDVSQYLVALLARESLDIDPVPDAEAARRKLSEADYAAVLSDLCVPGANGFDFIQELRALSSNAPIVVMTGLASVQSSVAAFRGGAFDYLVKPLDAEQVVAVLRKAVARSALRHPLAQASEACECGHARVDPLDELVGTSAKIREIRTLIRRVAPLRSSVLITGESGTGKEVIASLLHRVGSRRTGPFVPVNCAAIPDALLESELFGHVRGAFTGAHGRRTGLFSEANKGTLLLDEIGELRMDLQAKLLRVLQERVVRPVGASSAEPVDVRLVAATCLDLQRAIREGRFRADLFYRLNVIPIHVPPLRERPEDIPLLAQEFLQRAGGPEGPPLTRAAIQHLCKLPWPGNARELANTLERALVLCEGKAIQPQHLIADPTGRSAWSGGGDWLDEALRLRLSARELTDRYIGTVLTATGGKKTSASKILGLDRRTLHRWEVGRRKRREAEREPTAPERP